MKDLINFNDLNIIIIAQIPYKIIKHMGDNFILIDEQFLPKFQLTKNLIKTINNNTKLPKKLILEY